MNKDFELNKYLGKGQHLLTKRVTKYNKKMLNKTGNIPYFSQILGIMKIKVVKY